MTGQNDNDPDEIDYGDLHGPSESDIERFNREDAEYLDYRRGETRSAFWKLVAGAIFMLLVTSMFLNVLLPAFSRNRSVNSAPERVSAVVSRVFDARTIGVQIDGASHTVRYIGVDGPIFGDPLYEAAVSTNARWLLGQRVLLEADEVETDSRGRLLRYVWIDDAMVNINLVGAGFTLAPESSENNRYANLFREAEAIARSERRGIWEDGDPRAERSARAIALSAPPGTRPMPA